MAVGELDPTAVESAWHAAGVCLLQGCAARQGSGGQGLPADLWGPGQSHPGRAAQQVAIKPGGWHLGEPVNHRHQGGHWHPGHQ